MKFPGNIEKKFSFQNGILNLEKKEKQFTLQSVWGEVLLCNSVYDARIRQAADGWLDQPGANLKTADFLDVSQRCPWG